MAKFLGNGSDSMLDEHDSPQWYDIVHFKYKLLWLCFDHSFPKLADALIIHSLN